MKQQIDTAEEASHCIKMATPELTIETMTALLDNKLKKVATSAQLDEMNTRIGNNTKQIENLKQTVDKIEREVDKNHSKTVEVVQRIVEEKIEQCRPNGSFDHTTKEAAYMKSRRSLRIWPIRGKTKEEWKKNFEEFALEMGRDEIDDLGIEEITKTRLPPRSNIHQEILVTFSSSEARDSVAMRGGYLATFINENRQPLAGLRMDVPSFLTRTFKLLNSYGYHLRRVHGQSTKKYVKFDEAGLTLYLDVRLPDSDEWLQISPTQARALKDQRDATNLNRLT